MNSFKAYLSAVYDEDAVEGSLATDNTFAAITIRNKAREINSPLADKKCATISKALGVVLRRYNQDRKTRRRMVDGVIVPDSNDNNC